MWPSYLPSLPPLNRRMGIQMARYYRLCPSSVFLIPGKHDKNHSFSTCASLVSLSKQRRRPRREQDKQHAVYLPSLRNAKRNNSSSTCPPASSIAVLQRPQNNSESNYPPRVHTHSLNHRRHTPATLLFPCSAIHRT
jgi:hypothetical protein